MDLTDAPDATTSGSVGQSGHEARPSRRRSRLTSRWVLLVIALVVVGLGVILARHDLASGGGDELKAEGTLEAQEIAISADVTARIVELPFTEGQRVHAGDVLVRLDDSVEQIQYQQADGAQQQVIAAQLKHYVVSAPRDGIVLRRDAEPGEVAAVGQPLLVIADLSTLDLALYVSQRELPRVHLGQEVRLVLEAAGGETFAGSVASISDQAEFTPRNTQTTNDRLNLVFRVNVKVANPEGQLKPGMTVIARFAG